MGAAGAGGGWCNAAQRREGYRRAVLRNGDRVNSVAVARWLFLKPLN